MNLQELNKKLVSKNDLHNYLAFRVNVVLPEVKYCTLVFMQQILSGKKKYLLTTDVNECPPAIGKYPEFAACNVVPHIRNVAELMEYFPDEFQRDKLNFSDRHFMWTVIFNQYKEWGDKYFKEVMDFRHSQPKVAPTERMLTVTDDWLQKLKAFDYSTKNKNPKINIFSMKK